MNALQNVRQVRKLFGELHEIQKRPYKYAAMDMANWLEKNLDEIGYMLDEIEIELMPEYPDQQLILNAEHNEEIERKWAV